ncbi:putative copper amine oxidase [Naematelia encephala]|uniref:Amine oxidase n=1 Tax=Naematelia encephala TaxID=71784 RepID=A0A1Y2B4B3_9TREE|nr:putative copper amine oxidase [Naematelia encephala]
MRFFPLLALLGTALAMPSPKISSVRPNGRRPLSRRQLSTDSANITAAAPSASAPSDNLWKYFSNDEAADLISYLHNQTDLNLTAVADAGAWDNTILVVDVLPPAKADALAYLDNNGTKPERWATVHITFGATEEPYVQEFLVGPLPASDKTGHYPNTAGTQAKDAKIRVYDLDDTYSFFLDTAFNMSDIVSDLLNATITSTDDIDNTFDIWGIDPLWHEQGEDGSDRVINWVGFWRYPDEIDTGNSTFNFDGETLLPQGLYMKFDVTGRDPSGWSLKGILYTDEYYTSIDEFRTAWQKEGFIKVTPTYSGEWIGTDQTGDILPLETESPPVNVQPQGQRFKVDEEQKWVEWMDFSFYITFTRDTGLRLFDIKYKGDRILYELGLQEAIAHYAGNDPVQSGTGYLDTYYGFGPYAFSLVPGFDIPDYAYCIDSKFHAAEISVAHRCGIAVFEADQNYLMQRHSTDEYLSATKNVALTVRSVSTVGNYDYNFDYNFYLDGTIEITVRASGYIQSAYYANNTEYGYKIHKGLSGSMHDHNLNFKADFDILGVNNTMVKHTVEPITVQYKWNPTPRNTMHLVRTDVLSEDEGKQRWSANAQEQVLVVNKDELNANGEERGYKIMPSRGAGMYLTVQNSSNLFNSQSFATDAYYVLKRKDTELRASNAWNRNDPERPLVDFATFFNGESLLQEDLVVFFNLGMHHVPHTGDLPNTVFTTAQSSMMITPHNYLLSDPSRQSTQMIRINYNNDNVSDVVTFGSQEATAEVNLAQTAWDPWTYSGDVATRKFPYDPENPYNDTESIV